MCGIAGIVDLKRPGAVSEEAVRRMTARLVHRGPDAQGYRFEECVGLGHCRLKVIDLEGGAQPMTNENGTLWVVYNGEVYNFKELARELEGLGHRFASSCDTEVILHAYEQWGTDCLERMNGMFAFALWDGPARRLFLARDRLGIKPLFFAHGDGRLAFASELRALLPALESRPEVDPFGLASYFLLQYVPSPGTILRGIRKMPAGNAALLDETGFRQWRWWSPPRGRDILVPHRSLPDRNVGPPVADKERLLELLEDSVRLRLISDVPLGAFLSGGIDSSTVVGMMSRHSGEPIRSFQVAFEEPPGYDETRFARLAADHFKTRHERLVMRPADLSDLLPRIARGLGEPVADPALIPTYMVSKLAREHVTVAITGEGADELFAGYLRYGLERLSRHWGYFPRFARRFIRSALGRIKRSNRILKGIDALDAPAGAARHMAWVNVLPPQDLDALLPDIKVNERIKELQGVFEPYFDPVNYKTNPLGKTLRADIGTWLPDDLLAKVDAMSMAHGLEARVPFLDHRLVEWALELPESELIDGLTQKALLKKAVSNLVPEEIIHRAKRGFTLPLDEWFRGPLRDFLHGTLETLPKGMPAQMSVMRGWIEDHDSGKSNHGLRLFSLLTIALWLEGIE